WLKNHCSGFLGSISESDFRSKLKGKSIRVNRVVRSVCQHHFHAVDFESGQRTVCHSCSESFFYRRNIFSWNVSSLNFINKLQPSFASFISRPKSKDDISEFTSTTCLSLINLSVFSYSGKSFFIFHLRLTLVNIYLELSSQTIHNNIKVKLTHSGNNSLSRSFIISYLESRIFLSKFRQCHSKLIDIRLGLRLNSHPDYRVRENHTF